MSESTPLDRQRCLVLTGATPALDAGALKAQLAQVEGWQLAAGTTYDSIVKTYAFKDHYETIAFVNALAWISHREDHHPDLALGYNQCRVTYSSHAVNGLSINDFICAAKVDALVKP